jgi:secondary thiamine-phosphate synthase enzyme
LTSIILELSFHTNGEGDIVDITNQVSRSITESGLRNGIATIFVKGSTAALTTIEYEPGLLKDFHDMLNRLMPRGLGYEHEKRWHDGNGHSHVRASLIGPDLTIPFSNGELTLGIWQRIALVELDTHSRNRDLALSIIGE